MAGEKYILERYHFPKLLEGGIEGLVLSLWARPEEGKTCRDTTEQMMACALEEFAENPWLRIVHTSSDAAIARKEGLMYAFLGVEGMAAVEEDISYIDRYADFGARMGMLTWNEENLLATGAKGDPQKGLTALGKQAVRRMLERKMLVDVSHLNVGGFWDVISLVDGPVIASHSNCRAICDVPRNLTDDQLRAIRDTGGVVGLNVHHGFAHTKPEHQTVETLARHAAHMADVMGVEYISCGFDFCEYFGPGNDGVRGMEDCSCTGNFFAELEKLGLTKNEQQMIARENLLRLL